MQVTNPPKQYVMFDLISSTDGIFYYENVFSYEDIMLEYLNELDLDERTYSHIPKWKPWTASNSEETRYGDKKEIRPEVLNKTTGNELLDMRIRYIINSMLMAPEMCAKDFARRMGMNPEDVKLNTSNMHLCRYHTGQGMGPHYDGQDGDDWLKYTIVVYLNDDYEGGELHLKNQNFTLKPKAGSLVIFPSQEPYIHESKPVISGMKYMYTTHWVV